MEVSNMDLKLVKLLRETTGAGMLECKKALEITQDNLEEAIKYLESHMKHESTNQRVASKGSTRVITHLDEAILFEVNAETDFAAKNPFFLDIMDKLSEVFIANPIKNVKEALAFMMDGKRVEDHIQYVSGQMKEHLYLRRFHRIKKQPNQGFGTYIHVQGKLSVLVILNKPNESLGKQIAMAIAASSPTYISINRLDADTLNYEKFLYEKDPQGFKSFENFLNQKLLLNVPSISNPNQTIGQSLNEVNLNVIDFYRFELGQGIEDKLNCRLDVPCDGSTITVTPIY